MSAVGLQADELVCLLDGLDVLVCGLDGQGRIIHHNRSCETVTGLGHDQLRERSWLEIFAGSERSDVVRDLWQQVAAGNAPSPFEALYRNERRIQWRFSSWPTVTETRGGVCALGIDVTTDRSELLRARETERNLAVAQLGAGLAHEIRNPLNSAKLQLELASRQIASFRTERAGESVERAQNEILRANALLTDFLIFARPPKIELANVDLRQLVGRAVARVGGASPRGVPVHVEPGVAPIIEADEELLGAALEQLLENAIDAAATRDGEGKVVVRVRLEGNTALVEVEDNGPGLSSPDAPIFDAFFTTKPGSTGLGLAIVRRVAFSHGGAAVHARRGDKTIFTLSLPVVFGAKVSPLH